MADAQYTQYYVAFLDILGFKNRVNEGEGSCQKILDTYEFVDKQYKEFFDDGYEHLYGSIKMKIMSDSICLYTEVDIPNALFLLITYCVCIQHDLLIRDQSVFVRGGITVGQMYAKGDIIFGPALTEAYLLEEKNAKVPRIIVRKNTVDHGRSGCDPEIKEQIDKWIFRDDDAFYAINYFQLLNINDDKKAISHIKKTVSDALDTTTDESIRQKYLYVEKQMRKYVKENADA